MSDFTSICNHDHDLACDRCNRFSAVVQEVELQLNKANIPQEDKEEMKFVVAQFKKNIDFWKSHILRYINQDEARLDIINTLDKSSMLVVLDWAMNLSQEGTERAKQTGLVSKVFPCTLVWRRKKAPGESLRTLTLVHMFQKGNQDSLYVLAIINDIIEKMKIAIAGLKFISLRQDNAGCYHSAATILGASQLAIKHNVSMRMDFSDPLGGKGACNRKAATIKEHMRPYLNSGHEISTAEAVQSTIQSIGGIRGVATVRCGFLTISDPRAFSKWDGVSFINSCPGKERLFFDKALQRYALNLKKGTKYIESQIEEVAHHKESMNVPSANIGWTLKYSLTSRRRLNNKQKSTSLTCFYLVSRQDEKQIQTKFQNR